LRLILKGSTAAQSSVQSIQSFILITQKGARHDRAIHCFDVSRWNWLRVLPDYRKNVEVMHAIAIVKLCVLTLRAA